MDLRASIEQFSQENVPPELLAEPLPDELASAVVEHLKNEADRYWYINPNRSLELADRIAAIGEHRHDPRQTALGLMARGDALKFLGRVEEAWKTLEQAGLLFQSAGDEVGWARTRIGRLDLGVKLNRVAEALADTERARQIFEQSNERERLLRLNLALAIVNGMQGSDEQLVLELLQSALDIAEELGKAGEQYLGVLYMNTGNVYETLGDFSKALGYYERALAVCKARGEIKNALVLELNIANIAKDQGHYKHALSLLHGILERHIEQFPVEHLSVKRDMADCYLRLNRYPDARDLAREVIAGYLQRGDVYERALSTLYLGTAEAELGNYPAALSALQEAGQSFDSLGASSWSATTRLKRGQLALKQGDSHTALEEAAAAVGIFNADGQLVNYAESAVLQGRAWFALNELGAAEQAARLALSIAHRYGVPPLKYSAHLLLGRAAEAKGSMPRAIRNYQAASATVERVQRGLTITLRPGFLEDKEEALHALLAIYLRTGRAADAFETLERTKSQVLLGYLVNREALHWAAHEPRSQALIQELQNLRAEHEWFYHLAHDPPRDMDSPRAVSPQQALAEVAARERRMRAITEQLYIQGGDGGQAAGIPTTSLEAIQGAVKDNSLLIEFYNDGTRLWAFTLDGRRIDIQELPITVPALSQLLAQLQANLGAALQMDPRSNGALLLGSLLQRILQRLYASLLAPLSLEQRGRTRLVIVPYGGLHYLPFQLLHDGSAYLVENYQVVVLPAAGIATQPGSRKDPGALILAHSLEGRLPHTLLEAQMVQRLSGGRLISEQAAQRSALQAKPLQILHIAAHGEHRLDQPDLSYLQLADGQLYADDILQHDLSYELVTLSACETGRANVAAGDELIGLGRRFMYAGAGALLVSLWRVSDSSTLQLMEHFYANLFSGASKSAALREAQLSMIKENRDLHPAFWGAFQLIGNDDPLSSSGQQPS
jgi:CHAT domain-containing protein